MHLLLLLQLFPLFLKLFIILWYPFCLKHSNIRLQFLYPLLIHLDLFLSHLEHVFEFLDGKLFVYLCLVFDLLCALTELEGRLCLILVEDGWRTGDDQGCFGVATEGFLENTGELRVTIRDMC